LLGPGRGEREGGEKSKEREREEIMLVSWMGEKDRTPGKGRAEKEKWNPPKDLYVKSENRRDLFVKQNFPLI
jgi:hypothetical protein